MTRFARRGHASCRTHEDGVSNVLGAILMFGLLVITLSVIQVRFVPVWTEDREARHAQALADTLAQLKNDLDRQAGNDTAPALTTNLPLTSTGGFRLFQPPVKGAGTAQFTPSPSGTGIDLTTTKPLQILRLGGHDLFASGNAWDPQLEGQTQVTNVAAIHHLRERIDLTDDASGDSYLDPDSPAEYQDGDSVIIEIFDNTDALNPIATVTTRFHSTGGGSEVWFEITVQDGDGEIISTDFEAMFQSVDIDNQFFDLLDGALFLEPLLAGADPPFTIKLTESGLLADYQVIFTDADSGALSGTGGQLETAGYTLTMPSGRIEVDGQNQKYPDQTYILENGAVLLEQGTGATVIAAPAMAASIGPSVAALSWTVAGLDGSGLAITGDRVGVVSSPTGTTADIWVIAPQLTLTIPTEHGSAWATFLEDMLQDAGWMAGTYTAPTVGSSSVTLTLEGPLANDASCTSLDQTNCDYDVSFRLRIATIDLTLAPAG